MKNNDYEISHIKVLDGIRSLAIIIIVWYHFWQQTWITPSLFNVNLDFLIRYGFVFVDMLILLSSFCLFLPYARSMIYKENIPDTRNFYINRIARIVPSYLVSMIVSIIFIIALKLNVNPLFFIQDTISHLLFTHNLFPNTLLNSNYISVLWTLGVEVQFYLVFPYMAKKFSKKPILTYITLLIMGFLCTYLIRLLINDYNISFLSNHTLTFIPVYANGMLLSWLYIKYTSNRKRNIKKDLLFTIVSIFCIYLYQKMCLNIGNYCHSLQICQINYRFLLSCLFSIFIVSTMLSHKIYRFLFENKLMKFIAVISFNLYIYHQFIAVMLKELRIPFWEGEIPPNITGDNKWQWSYFIICIIVSLVIAIIMTYVVEKPLSKYIKKRFKKK